MVSRTARTPPPDAPLPQIDSCLGGRNWRNLWPFSARMGFLKSESVLEQLRLARGSFPSGDLCCQKHFLQRTLHWPNKHLVEWSSRGDGTLGPGSPGEPLNAPGRVACGGHDIILEILHGEWGSRVAAWEMEWWRAKYLNIKKNPAKVVW